MAGIQLSGLASGLDWQSLITQIMAVNSAGVTKMQGQQTTIATQNAALTTLTSSLNTLQTNVTALSDKNLFNQRTATASNSQWTVTAAPTATPTTHTIAVSQLATTAKLQGASGISGPIRADGDTSQVLISGMNLAQTVTAGQFSVNGAKVSIATTDTLSDVFQKISDATGGAVTASYDGTSDTVSLSGSGPIVLGSANDTSNFLQALKLNNNGTGSVSSSTRLGAVKLDAPLSSAGLSGSLSGGAGSLTVNGVAINYNSSTDSLRTVIARINGSTAGVTAAYDAQNDRLVLTNNVTGDLGVSVQDQSGNLASTLGLSGSATLVRGNNAQFSVDGGPTRTSATNGLDENALGVTGLSVTLATQTTETIAVGSDTSSVKSKIQDFITQLNGTLSYAEDQTKVTTSGTKVTTGTLYGDDAVKDVTSSIRSAIFQSLGGSGSIQRLEQLGIDFDGENNKLVIKDPTKLDNALLTAPNDVASFFTSPTTGLAARLTTIINHQTGTDGTLVTDQAGKSKQSSNIGDQITDLQRRLDQQKASLTAQFVQMEQMQSLLQSQMQALNSAFGTSGSTGTGTASSSKASSS